MKIPTRSIRNRVEEAIGNTVAINEDLLILSLRMYDDNSEKNKIIDRAISSLEDCFLELKGLLNTIAQEEDEQRLRGL